MSPLLSRKFIVAVLALLSLDVLLYLGLLSDSLYVTALIATVGAYLTANVAQKVSK